MHRLVKVLVSALELISEEKHWAKGAGAVDGSGAPVLVEAEVLTSVPLHVGAGYSGDPDWSHGRWMGRDWSATSVYDLTDPDVIARFPWGGTDHLVRARLDGEEGWGMFEHSSMGRHDPTGMADWSSVAPERP